MNMANRSVDQRRNRLVRALAIGLGTIALLGACTSDGSRLDDLGGGGDAPAEGGTGGEEAQPGEPAPEPEAPEPEPEPEAPEPETPAPEPEVPTPEPPAGELPEETPDDDGLSTQEWVVLLIIGIAALALVMGVVSLATNHTEKKKIAQSSQNRRVGELVGLGRWILDQGSVEVLRATEARQLQTAWLTMRARSIDLETRSASLASTIDDPNVGDMILRLATGVAALRGSLDTNVSLRLDPNATANTVLIDDTTRSVYQRRQDVQLDLSRLAAARS